MLCCRRLSSSILTKNAFSANLLSLTAPLPIFLALPAALQAPQEVTALGMCIQGRKHLLPTAPVCTRLDSQPAGGKGSKPWDVKQLLVLRTRERFHWCPSRSFQELPISPRFGRTKLIKCSMLSLTSSTKCTKQRIFYLDKNINSMVCHK